MVKPNIEPISNAQKSTDLSTVFEPFLYDVRIHYPTTFYKLFPLLLFAPC